jgi:riboflavin biosynthesis pyrimidine reductase
MSVIASLVVAKDGSTIKGGRSSGVASIEDRNRFLARRRKADCILIGGNTPEVEKWRFEKAIERTKERRPDLL